MRSTKAMKTIHTIRDEDLRAACCRWLIAPEEFLKRVNEARLEREWDELHARFDRLMEQSQQALETRDQTLWRTIQTQIDGVMKQQDRNMEERFGQDCLGRKA